MIRHLPAVISVGVLLVGILLVIAPAPAPAPAAPTAPTIPCVHADGREHYVTLIDEPE